MAVPAPSWRFGVTATDVASLHLARLTPDTSSGAELDVAISQAASRLTNELRAWDITPAAITEADYPDDYAWCWHAVAKGAASAYIFNATGVSDADLESDWRDSIDRVRRRPQTLTIYQASTGANTPSSHMDTLDAGTVSRLETRMARTSPANRVQWETL